MMVWIMIIRGWIGIIPCLCYSFNTVVEASDEFINDIVLFEILPWFGNFAARKSDIVSVCSLIYLGSIQPP
jgi:hypothetical protein